MSILFLGKHGDFYCQRAAEFAALSAPEVDKVFGARGEPFPNRCLEWEGDYIVSYLSRWVIPEALLGRARIASINFHPGPPEYPGIGCTNFALYRNETVYGVTCHHMAPQVDTGKIVQVKRFAVLPTDNVYSLTQRCYAHLLGMFYEVMTAIFAGRPFPESTETWRRPPYKRAELEALCKITPDMAVDEIRRRIRAVTFPGAPGAYVELGGVRFEPVLSASDRENE